MKAFLRTLLHAFISATAVGGAAALSSGAAVTSGNVLLPALTAGAAGAIHAGCRFYAGYSYIAPCLFVLR